VDKVGTSQEREWKARRVVKRETRGVSKGKGLEALKFLSTEKVLGVKWERPGKKRSRD